MRALLGPRHAEHQPHSVQQPPACTAAAPEARAVGYRQGLRGTRGRTFRVRMVSSVIVHGFASVAGTQ